MKIRNTFIIFIVSGFWHGANWTFIVWGALNAFYFLPLLIANKNRTNIEIVAQGKYLPNFKQFFQIALTFGLTVFAWIFFRANNIEHAFNYITQIFNGIFQHPGSILLLSFWSSYKTIFIILIIFIIIEWRGRDNQYAIAKIGLKLYRPLRWSMYCILVLAIFYFTKGENQFIYFQF